MFSGWFFKAKACLLLSFLVTQAFFVADAFDKRLHSVKERVGDVSRLQASDDEQKRAAAKQAVAEGDAFAAQRTAESLRQALMKYEKAVSLWREIKDARGEAETLNKIANVLSAQGEYKKAVEQLEKALPLSKQINDKILEAEILSNCGTNLSELGEVRKAVPYLDQALLILQTAGDKRRLASVLGSLGNNWVYLGDKQKGLDYMQQALQLHRETENKYNEAYTLNNMGSTYREMGEKMRALDYFRQSLEILAVVHNPNLESTVLSNLANVYQDLGEFQAAMDAYQRAIALSQRAGNKREQAVQLINLGTLYDELGEEAQAVEYLQKALTIVRELKDSRVEGHILYSLGAVALRTDPQKAIENFNQAREIWLKIGNEVLAKWALRGLGSAYRKTGEYAKSVEAYQQALEQIRSAKMPSEEAEVLSYLGNAYEAMGLDQKTLETYEQALTVSREIDYVDQEAEVLFFLARFERKRKNFEAARQYIENSTELIESLRANPANQDLRASFMALKQGYYELQTEILMDLQKVSTKTESATRYAALAFQASERARARSLLETLAEAKADIRQGVSAELLERELNLEKSVNEKAARRYALLKEKGKEQEVAKLDQEIAELRLQLSELRGKIRVESPKYASLVQPATLTLSETQNLLDDDTMLLEYRLGESRSFLWAITKDSFDYFELPKRAEIEVVARNSYEFLKGEQPSGPIGKQKAAQVSNGSDSLQTLSRMLLGPVASRLGKKRLIIVSDGILQYVPFAALSAVGGRNEVARQDQRPKTKDQPLIFSFEIVNLPSASVLAILRQEKQKRTTATKTVAVFADPVFSANDSRLAAKKSEKVSYEAALAKGSSLERSARDTGNSRLMRLHFSREEASEIAALASPGQSFVALDFDATRAAAMNSDMSLYKILHFSTHGLLDSARPELSGLVFSLFDEKGQPQDGFLRLHEIYKMNLNAELVVLSACQTALGKDVKGEGLVGLTRGFMHAGVPRVVASLWRVDDRATAELMKRFYQKMLKENLRPAAALREAQISMLNELRWSKPQYWAAFTLQGEWR